MIYDHVACYTLLSTRWQNVRTSLTELHEFQLAWPIHAPF